MVGLYSLRWGTMFYSYTCDDAQVQRTTENIFDSGLLYPVLHSGIRVLYRSACNTPVPLIQVGPPGSFVHVSITTPIVSALKNYYR